MVALYIATLLALGGDAKKRCVHFESGVSLGYKAQYEFKRLIVNSTITLKMRDGTVLIDDELDALWFTKSTVYGYTSGIYNQRRFGFAWRDDVGLVKSYESQALYEEVIAEAGALSPSSPSGYVGGRIIFDKLKNQTKHKDQRCRTPLFAW
ncbi:MAG: hypothetical protein OXR62_15450 [Ahrensia sp.]|nr:hypothetical protein [Ahrensia sp.]